jgi:hypothetical protein
MNQKTAMLFFGVFFGFALSRVGAGEYDLIYGMFTATNLKLAWVMITAIVTGHLGMRWLASKGNVTKGGAPIKVNLKKLRNTSLLGGAIFGIGWGLSGACPGTVLAQLGEGKVLGLFTAVGMIFGTYLYALLVEKYPNLSD